MKTKSILLTLAFFFIVNIAGAFSVRYYNKDSQKHKMEVKVNGSTKTIEFSASTTSTASVQTSNSVIEVKTKCGWVKLENGDKITIKDGCIKIN